MIRLPVFENLDIDGYGMYPGTDEQPGLHIEFGPGLTLVLGANGLGKTTLVTLLYRLCSGPYEISGMSGSATLGNVRLEATKLSRPDQRLFAARVTDNAATAMASLKFSIGSHCIEVQRRLDSLAVANLVVDGKDIQASDDTFQEIVTDFSGLPTFGDWILVLRYLVFYFEDRRALVWDPSAQRQILRLMLLPKDASTAWASKEREVLELDSRVRNLQNALNREEGMERVARTRAKQGPEVTDKLAEHEKVLKTEVRKLEAASEELPGAEAERQRARLRSLTIEQEHDSARQALERLQLSRISESFPSSDETAQYLLTRLISTDICQTCNSHVPEVAESLLARVTASQCIVCGSQLTESPRRSRSLEADLEQRSADVNRLEAAMAAARGAREQAEAHYVEVLGDFSKLDVSVSQRRETIARLVHQLPSDERTLHAQAAEVSTLRGRLERLKVDLDQLRLAFEELVTRDMATIAKHRDTVVASFREFAEGFLFESSQLRWAPHKSRVGQTGPLVDFPAFEFEMGGSDFPSPVRRSGPDQVSESQREFVDLAFRMALMKVAGEAGAGSIVIDAPESSLDAVFSERAATVLVRFADPKLNNRIVVTSNLVDGQLIPKMLAEAEIRSIADSRVVDLLTIATPTSAIRNLAGEYERVRDGLFAAAKSRK